MVEAGWGRIINISGRDGFSGILNRAHGVTVKAGIHGFTKALALEFGPSGINVNTVVPGLIQTTRPKEWYPTLSYEERSKGIPVRHPGSVEDIAATVRFLVLEGDYITGQAVHVNGGEVPGHLRRRGDPPGKRGPREGGAWTSNGPAAEAPT